MHVARRGMALRAAPLAALVVTAVMGCSSAQAPAPPPGTPSLAARGHTASAAPVDASCPVTRPMPAASVPHVLRTLPVSGWYGKGGLWMNMGASGDSVSIPPLESGVYRLKYASFTLDSRGRPTSRTGPPTLDASRLDGPGTARGSTGGYALGEAGSDNEFWPTTINFPARGCWLLTEALRATTIRFIIRVR
jgi:hypothetical protein